MIWTMIWLLVKVFYRWNKITQHASLVFHVISGIKVKNSRNGHRWDNPLALYKANVSLGKMHLRWERPGELLRSLKIVICDPLQGLRRSSTVISIKSESPKLKIKCKTHKLLLRNLLIKPTKIEQSASRPACLSNHRPSSVHDSWLNSKEKTFRRFKRGKNIILIRRSIVIIRD